MNAVDHVALFISNRGLAHLDREWFRSLPGCRRVAFLGDGELGALPSGCEGLFDEIIVVPEADRKGILPVLDVDALHVAARKVLAAHPGAKAGIICHDEGNTLEAAIVRERLGLPGPGYDAILPFRDKELMKRRVEAAGIRVPRHGSLDLDRFARDRERYAAELIERVGLPLVLKPLDSAGSDGVHLVFARDELLALELRLRGAPYAYEEYIAGDLYHCDFVVRERAIIFAEASRYSCGNYDFQLGKTLGSLPLRADDPRRTLLLGFAEAALRALGLPDGAFHGEAFLTPRGEPVFLEVAARAPGLLIVPMYERHVGVNVMSLDIAAQLGLSAPRPRTETSNCFYALVPARAGRVTELRTPPIASEHVMRWRVSVGDALGPCRSNLDQAGALTAWNPDYAALEADFNAVTSAELLVCA